MPLKIYICKGTTLSCLVSKMWLEWGHEIVSSVEDSDFVVFTGGADLNPRLYGQGWHPLTRSNTNRDNEDLAVFYEATGLGKPMIGICRGAQLLHVMNGGELYQDVDHHRWTHSVYPKELVLPRRGTPYRVTSTHHQMMIADKYNDKPRYQVLLTAKASSHRDHVTKAGATLVNTEDNHEDLEAIFYPDSLALCFQGHPEYSNLDDDTDMLFKACINQCFGLNL